MTKSAISRVVSPNLIEINTNMSLVQPLTSILNQVANLGRTQTHACVVDLRVRAGRIVLNSRIDRSTVSVDVYLDDSPGLQGLALGGEWEWMSVRKINMRSTRSLKVVANCSFGQPACMLPRSLKTTDVCLLIEDIWRKKTKELTSTSSRVVSAFVTSFTTYVGNGSMSRDL
jgi:hypothetical protein